MNTRTTWSIIILIAAIALFGWIIYAGKQIPAPQQPAGEVPSEVPAPEVNSVTFYSASGEKVTATFGDNYVAFSSEIVGNMTLPQALSGSGARYADANEKVVFWNKGNEVTIYQDNKIVFSGSTEQPKGKLPAGSDAPGTADEVRASTWVWTKIVNKDGSVVTPKKPGIFTLKFEQDARVTGKTDCNGFGGTYEIGSDGVIHFGPFMSTLMFCEGSQETEYSNAVYYATSYSINSKGELVLTNKDGGMVYFTAKK